MSGGVQQDLQALRSGKKEIACGFLDPLNFQAENLLKTGTSHHHHPHVYLPI